MNGFKKEKISSPAAVPSSEADQSTTLADHFLRRLNSSFKATLSDRFGLLQAGFYALPMKQEFCFPSTDTVQCCRIVSRVPRCESRVQSHTNFIKTNTEFNAQCSSVNGRQEAASRSWMHFGSEVREIVAYSSVSEPMTDPRQLEFEEMGARNNRIAFGFEAHKNGHVNLLCSRPNCFEHKYAECDERPLRTSCPSNTSWIGGIERTVDGKIYLQCCEYPQMALYGEKLFDSVKVHLGEYFEGEEKTEDGEDYVIYFDVISNIRVAQSFNLKGVVPAFPPTFELTVHRYHCAREPPFEPSWRVTPPWPWRIPPVDANSVEGEDDTPIRIPG